MKKDILNETFNKHKFLLKKRLHEQGIIQREPVQEVELDEGFKDIALASLLGLSVLFTNAAKADHSIEKKDTTSVSTSSGEDRAIRTAKLGDASSGDLKARFAHLFPKDTNPSSEISNVKSAAQNAESLATEISKKLNVGDDYSKSSAKRILDDIVKFNKDNKFGSAAQMKIAIEHATSNNRYTDSEKPSDLKSLIDSMPGNFGKMLEKDDINKIRFEASDMANSAKDVLVKKYNPQNEWAIEAIRETCYYSAVGDFVQMIAEKLVQVATRP
jgi:hypothetical protein